MIHYDILKYEDNTADIIIDKVKYFSKVPCSMTTGMLVWFNAGGSGGGGGGYLSNVMIYDNIVNYYAAYENDNNLYGIKNE